MNVVTRNSGAPAPAVSVPVISADLGLAADAAMTYGVFRAPPPTRQSEARAALPALNAALSARPTRSLVKAWLEGVAAACNNPPGDVDFDLRLMSVIETSGDLPAAMWTPETRRELVRSKGAQMFWPGAGEVDAFLRAKHDQLVRMRDGILAIASHGQAQAGRSVAPEPGPEPVKPASVEERDRILSRFRAEYSQAMEPIREAASARPAGGMRVEPRPLSAGQLAMLRDQDPRVRAARALQAQMKAKEGEGGP